MKRALIFSNPDKQGAVELAKKIGKMLATHQVQAKACNLLRTKASALPQADFAISIGGDGTALSVCRLVADSGMPVLAINYGKLGFITEVSLDDWEGELLRVIKGTYHTEARIIVDIKVRRGNRIMKSFRGLNDAVISVAGISKLMRFSVYVNNQLLEKYRADGLIISTPTGSTAYSVAAGGPILHPTLQALVVNPICPFTLAHRPLVIPSSQTVQIRPLVGQHVSTVLTVDGQVSYQLHPDDGVDVEVSPQAAKIVRSEHYSFFEVIRRKLRWSGAADA